MQRGCAIFPFVELKPNAPGELLVKSASFLPVSSTGLFGLDPVGEAQCVEKGKP